MDNAPLNLEQTDKPEHAETIPTIHLKKGCAKPLHGGHPWVFLEAISRVDGKQAQSGDEVRVVDDRGGVLGRGFFSPASAIAVRILTRADAPITHHFFATRIDEAIRLRREILGLGSGLTTQSISATSVSPESPAESLQQKDRLHLKLIDEQLEKVHAFAAQYGMDAAEESSELRLRRDALLNLVKGTVPDGGIHRNAKTSEPRNVNTTAYRLVNSEGDGLGGLTVDVYGDYVAVQCGTAGMERRLSVVLDILENRLKPKGILDRSDARARKLEKLDPPKFGALRGQEPNAPHLVLEHGVELFCDLRSGQGQKTGLFLDQRENRQRFASFAAGRRVLDVFSYSGGFAVHAMKAGARGITLIDSSEAALELARVNMEHNKIDDADLLNAEWPEGFKHLREAGQQFDLVVLDPPKFARTREDVSQALSGYRDLNAQAVRLLAPGGLLMTCSCSGNVSDSDFERAVAAGVRASGRRGLLLERRGASPDHPIPPGFDQGRYLKCLLLQII